MKKKAKKSLAKQVVQHKESSNVTSKIYLMNERELEQLSPELRALLFTETRFASVEETTQAVIGNRMALFGEHTFLIQKDKDTARAQGTDPNYFLLDLEDTVVPKVYVLLIISSKDNFYSSIFPLVTRCLSYFNGDAMNQLREIIHQDKAVTKALEEDPDKLPGVLQNLLYLKPGVLIVSDEEIPELREVKEVYALAWQRVFPLVIRKYVSNSHTMCSISPLDYRIQTKSKQTNEKKEKVTLTEEDHLRGVSGEVSEVYTTLKTELLKVNAQLQFNSQKHYISIRRQRNMAVFHFSRKKITLVVLISEEETRKKIKHHVVKTLTPKVQQFWGGQSCSIVIEGMNKLNEVTNLLKKLVTA